MFHVSNSLLVDVEPGDYVLVEYNWDDWFTYETKYYLYARPLDGKSDWKEIGPVKIGQVDMPNGQRRAAIPNQFENLDEKFFSLGQVKATMRRW